MVHNVLKVAYSARRKAAELSVEAFARHYFPHHLKIEPSIAHKEVYRELSKATIERNKKITIAAPRDFGKSTTITLIYVIYLIAYSKESFIVIISHTAGQAQKILENIRKELTENEELKKDFPEIFENEGRPKPPRWKQDDIITRNNIEVLALGYKQKIRGQRHGSNRPSLIILDDAEPDNGWPSSEMAEKMKEWLNKAVLQAGSENTNFLFIGTVHHWLSVLGEYLKENTSPGWTKFKYQAFIEFPTDRKLWGTFSNIRNFKDMYGGKTGPEAAVEYYRDQKLLMDVGCQLLWPARWSILKLMEKFSDNEFSFMSEMQNDPRNISEYSFDVDNFGWCDDEYLTVDALIRNWGYGTRFYMGADPAGCRSLFKGDYSAIVVIACKGRDAAVIVADIARRSQDKFVMDMVAYAKRYPLTKLVIENNGFQELVVQALEKRALEEGGVYLPIERVTNSAKKQDRLFSLYTWVKNCTIKFFKSDHLLLEQFRWFPQAGKHDDGIDALEMAFRFAEINNQMNIGDAVKSLKQAKIQVPRRGGIIACGDQPFNDPFGLFRNLGF
jgi:predicted phage terminase large subunit-like protein